MALEDLLTKLITSLDANTAAHKASAGAGAAKAPAATTATPKAVVSGGSKTKITFNEIKAAAAKVLDKQGKPFTKKLIKDVGGAPELATVEPEKYGALMAAFTKALEDGGIEAEAEEEDEL
jgi:hypothetical protein